MGVSQGSLQSAGEDQSKTWELFTGGIEVCCSGRPDEGHSSGDIWSVSDSTVLVGAYTAQLEDVQGEVTAGASSYLGRSSLGVVVKSRHKASNSLRAVRQIRKTQLTGSMWKDEVQSFQNLEHEHICKLHEAWEDAKSVYLVLEFCGGGNLMQLCYSDQRLNETRVAILMYQICDAVAHLHEHKLVHSDIRPENWLFLDAVQPSTSSREMCLKMIDFGFASKYGSNTDRRRRQSRPMPVPQPIGKSNKLPTGSVAKEPSLGEQCRPKISITSNSGQSTPTSSVESSRPSGIGLARQQGDVPREVFCKAPEQCDEGSLEGSCDVWAIGILAYFLLSGQCPFDVCAGSSSHCTGGLYAPENCKSFSNARYVFMPAELWRPVSSAAKNFISLCLLKDPDTRPTAAQLLRLPWMRRAKSAMDRDCKLPIPYQFPSSPTSRHEKDLQEEDRLDLNDPALSTASIILGSLRRISCLQKAETAAIKAVAGKVDGAGLQALHSLLRHQEKSGVVTVAELLRNLETVGVSCDNVWECLELDEVVIQESMDYAFFLDLVVEFQMNVQDRALWQVFRRCDLGKGAAKTKVLIDVIGPMGQYNEEILAAFSEKSLTTFLDKLRSEKGMLIDFQKLEATLMLTKPGTFSK